MQNADLGAPDNAVAYSGQSNRDVCWTVPCFAAKKSPKQPTIHQLLLSDCSATFQDKFVFGA